MKYEDNLPTYSIESLKSKQPSRPKEFEYYRFEDFAREIEHLRKPHRHQFYAFFLVTKGKGSHDIDFQTYELKPGRLFLIAPGQVHAWNKISRVHGFVTFFTDSFVALSKGRKIMAAWPVFRPEHPCFVDLTSPDGASWVREFEFMEAEMIASDGFSRDSIFYTLGRLLVQAARLFVRFAPLVKSPKPDLVQEFRDLIEKSYAEKHKPMDYAVMLNVTPNHLNMIAKKTTGKSAGILIRDRLLLEAKRLLAHTPLTVAEVGYTLNFTDNSYFGRYFKEHVGMTPQAFRKKNS